jgi:hypothetical protein
MVTITLTPDSGLHSRDLTAKQIRSAIEEFRASVSGQGQEQGPGFFAVVCVMSHGRRVGTVDEVDNVFK